MTAMAPRSDTDLLNIDELRAVLNVRSGVVKRLWRTGELPSRVVGKVRVSTWGEVAAWLDRVSVTHYEPPADPLPKRWTLYRFYDRDGSLLYVGITGQGASRWAQHAAEKPWWLDVATIDVEHHPSLEAVIAAEADAIHDERPMHNVRGARR